MIAVHGGTMSKRIMLGAAAAAVVIATPRVPGKFGALDKMPVQAQATQVHQMFRAAKTPQDYLAATSRWTEVRPRLAQSEKSMACEDTGEKYDRQLILDTVEDVVKKPIGLIGAISKFIFAFAGGEKDETLEALKEAAAELGKFAFDKGKDRVLDRAKELALKNIQNQFKEALLRYLQSLVKRSRKHCLELIRNIAVILKGVSVLTFEAAKVALTPSRISPEWCGYLEIIDEEQHAAFRRVFGNGSATVANRKPR
jgi:hypothetical protein